MKLVVYGKTHKATPEEAFFHNMFCLEARIFDRSYDYPYELYGSQKEWKEYDNIRHEWRVSLLIKAGFRYESFPNLNSNFKILVKPKRK